MVFSLDLASCYTNVPLPSAVEITAAGAKLSFLLDRLEANDNSKNGVFTRVFLQEMKKVDLPIERVIKNVRTEVVRLARTIGHDQVPAIYDEIVGDFYFKQ